MLTSRDELALDLRLKFFHAMLTQRFTSRADPARFAIKIDARDFEKRFSRIIQL